MNERYQRPGWFTERVFNRVVPGLTRVRNLRARGEGRLLVGRRAEAFTAVELTDEDKPPLLRAYLERWKWEVGAFFGGAGPDSTDDELRRIAPDHPIFRIGPPG